MATNLALDDDFVHYQKHLPVHLFTDESARVSSSGL